MNRRRGFTIVELAVVVVVIGILASLVYAGFARVQAGARDDKRKSDAITLRTAIEHYATDNGEPPWPATGYTAGTTYDIAILAPLLVPKYISEIPKPPRDNPYSYYRYVINTDQTKVSWAIEIRNETKPTCKVGRNFYPGWYSNAPACDF